MVPEQPGLKQRIWLGLENDDELCLGVGGFQGHWFPCTDDAIVKGFHKAAYGFLSGNYRVLEWRRGKRCVEAELQAPVGHDWEVVSKFSTFSLWPFPREKKLHELRNA